MSEESSCPVPGCDLPRAPARAVCERCWFEAPLQLKVDWNAAVRNEDRAAAGRARDAIVAHHEERRP